MQDRRVMNRRRKFIFGFTAAAAALCAAVLLTPAWTEVMQEDIAGRAGVELAESRIVIRKKARTLELYDGERLTKVYTMALGFAPEGDKEKEGDGKTPEGDFYVFTKNSKSKFHLSIGLSYPSVDDAQRGLKDRLISLQEHDAIVGAIERKEMPPQKTALGGEIYIHGGGAGSDWTWGCIALENKDIEEIFAAIKQGIRVSIVP